jgi:hypothetical protein
MNFMPGYPDPNYVYAPIALFPAQGYSTIISDRLVRSARMTLNNYEAAPKPLTVFGIGCRG